MKQADFLNIWYVCLDQIVVVFAGLVPNRNVAECPLVSKLCNINIFFTLSKGVSLIF